jgi:hypothetical protein
VPANDRAGWGYLLLTNLLPNQGNGEFRIYAYADDTDGHTALLGMRRIVGANATSPEPFGTIDTPGQGETVFGTSYLNFGWALTPQPKSIPIDGSTIQVYIDGLPVGGVNYNHYRQDVSTTFPGLANSGGPVGFRAIDTTQLADGVHTIGWLYATVKTRRAGSAVASSRSRTTGRCPPPPVTRRGSGTANGGGARRGRGQHGARARERHRHAASGGRARRQRGSARRRSACSIDSSSTSVSTPMRIAPPPLRGMRDRERRDARTAGWVVARSCGHLLLAAGRRIRRRA